MRITLVSLFLINHILCNGQSFIEGKYRDHFEYQIEFYDDSTFEFNYQFDLASGWAIGTWKVDNDTIFFSTSPIFDTLRRYGEPDSLVLSLNKTSELITAEQFAIDQITSGRQLPTYVPDKLYMRKGRLYQIKENGRIKKKKVRGIFTG